MSLLRVFLRASASKERRLYFRAKADPRNPQHDPVYAAMISSPDDNVGRILKVAFILEPNALLRPLAPLRQPGGR